MDSTTYQSFTGKTVNASQTARFTMQQKVAKKWLERELGYPLCPDEWGNQYIEKGKTNGVFILPDNADLLPPDNVVNAYRFFEWNPNDPFIALDPFTKVHAIKLVQDDVTIWEFETNRFMPQMDNYYDQEPFARFLAIRKPITELFLFNGFVFDWVYYWNFFIFQKGFKLAIDADWAFDELPLELKEVWADMIRFNMDDKRNISLEAIGSREHQYSKFSPDIDNPLIRFAEVIKRYAGPNRPGGKPGVL